MRPAGLAPARSLRPRRPQRRVSAVPPGACSAQGGIRTHMFAPPETECVQRCLRPSRKPFRHLGRWARRDLNPQPSGYKPAARTIELRAVEKPPSGIEPPASPLPRARSAPELRRRRAGGRIRTSVPPEGARLTKPARSATLPHQRSEPRAALAPASFHLQGGRSALSYLGTVPEEGVAPPRPKPHAS